MIGKWNVDVETRRYDINSLLLHSKIIGWKLGCMDAQKKKVCKKEKKEGTVMERSIVKNYVY
jgi:hypothetical protein